jgi:hypothetical protein
MRKTAMHANQGNPQKICKVGQKLLKQKFVRKIVTGCQPRGNGCGQTTIQGHNIGWMT